MVRPSISRFCPRCGEQLKLSNHHTYHCSNENCSVHRVRYDRAGRVVTVDLSAESRRDALVHPEASA